MTRTTHWRSPTPLGQSRQANHGHKRKGKAVEALMMELERENEENASQNSLDLSAIEQIANGVERMVFSWDLDKEERGQEYAKVSKSLAKDTAQMLLPWSPTTNEQVNSCSHVDIAKHNIRPLGIAQVSTPPSNPSLHSPKTHMSPPTIQYPAIVELQNEGTLEAAIVCKGRRGFQGSNYAVLKSNNLLINTSQPRGNFEKRARDDSTCQQESSSVSTLTTDDGIVQVVATSGQSMDSSKDGDDANLQFSLKGESHMSVIQSNTHPMRNEGDQFPLSPIRVGHSGHQTPLLSQSPLYVGSPMGKNDAIHCRETLNGSRGGSTDTYLSTYLDPSPRCQRDSETIEVGGHAIKITSLQNTNEILENKFQTLVNISPEISRLEEYSSTPPSRDAQVEELQIALLECAMEYEIKTIETKMKMQEIILQERQNLVVAKCEQPCLERALEVSPSDHRRLEFQRVQQIKKQVVKLQHEKDALSDELSSLKKKERQFERQKRSLEDAFHRVNRLQREVVKKDQEVVEWQLKDKETKAQLQDVGEKLRKACRAQALEQMEPKRLLKLLPALREWLRSLKKAGSTKVVEHRPFYQAHLGPLGQLSDQIANEPNSKLSIPQVDVIICCLTREIQALQNELSKLARG